jgi:hypothetical protein
MRPGYTTKMAKKTMQRAVLFGLTVALLLPAVSAVKELRLELKEGWNLVALPGEGNLSSGDCASVEALYGLVYLRDNGTYVTMDRASELMGERDLKKYLATNAFWVYSFKQCGMEFGLYNSTSFVGMGLDEGWNFLPVTEDMVNASLNEIGGGCDFHQAYHWDAETQQWGAQGMGERFTDDMLYTGFAVKTDVACALGETAREEAPLITGE